MKPISFLWHNGIFVPLEKIPPLESTLVADSWRSRDGKVRNIEAHIARFNAAVEGMLSSKISSRPAFTHAQMRGAQTICRNAEQTNTGISPSPPAISHHDSSPTDSQSAASQTAPITEENMWHQAFMLTRHTHEETGEENLFPRIRLIRCDGLPINLCAHSAQECGPYDHDHDHDHDGSAFVYDLRSAPPRRVDTTLLIAGPHIDPRIHPTIKGPDIERLEELRARAHPYGANDVVLTREGTVVEAGTGSLVWWRDGVLCVPPADFPVLPGTTRAQVEAHARALGIEVREDYLSIEELIAYGTDNDLPARSTDRSGNSNDTACPSKLSNTDHSSNLSNTDVAHDMSRVDDEYLKEGIATASSINKANPAHDKNRTSDMSFLNAGDAFGKIHENSVIGTQVNNPHSTYQINTPHTAQGLNSTGGASPAPKPHNFSLWFLNALHGITPVRRLVREEDNTVIPLPAHPLESEWTRWWLENGWV